MNAPKENQGPGGQEAHIYTSQIIVVMIASALVIVMLFLLLVCCNSTWYPEYLRNDNQSDNKSEWNTETRNRHRIVRTRKKKRRSNSCIAENNKELERPIIR